MQFDAVETGALSPLRRSDERFDHLLHFVGGHGTTAGIGIVRGADNFAARNGAQACVIELGNSEAIMSLDVGS